MKNSFSPKLTPSARCLLAVACGLSFLTAQGQAADGTWTFAGNGSWDLNTNWSGSAIATGVNSTATFSYGLPNTTNSVISVDTARSIGNLTFTGTAGTGTHNIILNGPAALTLSTGTATAPTITANMASRTITINTVLAGTEGVNLSNTNTALIMGGNNTYTGLTQITAGTVTVANNLAFGSTTGDTTLGASTAIILNNGIKVTGETINTRGTGAGTASGAIQTAANASAEWAGSIHLNNGSTRFGANGATSVLTLSGVISDGTTSGVPSAGSIAFGYSGTTGTLTLSGANTYTGSTQVIRGTLKLDGGNNRLPTGTSLDIWGAASGDNAVVELNGYHQTVAGLTRTGVVSGATSTLTNSSSTASIFTVNNSSAATYSGAITGNLAFVKDGTATQTLSGINTYTGDTTVTGGTLALADNAALTFYIGANGVNNQINGGGTLTLDGDFIFDLTGAALVNGNSWNIVNVATLSELFSANFTVQGFTEISNVWTSGNFQFSEATGTLTYSAVPEPSTYAMVASGLGCLWFLRRRRS